MRTTIILLIVGALACTKPNPNRCCVDQADCEANNIPVGSTCADGLLCRGNQCVAETCSTAAECDSSAPYCVAGMCGAGCSDDTECPGNGQDPSDLFCVSGTCVVCRVGMNDCPESAPVCDANSCRACAVDSECSSDLCDLDTGTCVPEAQITYASPSGSSSSACSLSDPCSLTQALSVVEADQARNNIKLAAGTYAPMAMTFAGALGVTIYGGGIATIAMTGYEWDVKDGATFRMRDLTVDGAFMKCYPSASTMPRPTVDVARVNFINVESQVNTTSGAPADTVTGTGSGCTHSYELIKPQSTSVPGTGNLLNVDPVFKDPANGDFHLQLGSPAIDTGNPAGGAPVDYDGTARPQGAGYDIGAFEYKP